MLRVPTVRIRRISLRQLCRITSSPPVGLICKLICSLCASHLTGTDHQPFAALSPSPHQSARGTTGQKGSNSQDTHRMSEHLIFLIMAPSLFPVSIHYRLCSVPFANSHSRRKQRWPLTTSALNWFAGRPGGRKRRRKTNDSISIITTARFNLLFGSISEVNHFSSKFKSPSCFCRSRLNQFGT